MNVWLSRGIFSLNSFVAAMLALYLALTMGLLNPFWSAMTVYIVSQPHTGSVRAKALYRLLGTIVGAAAAVLIVPNLYNAPELMSLALALWVGLCLGISLLDRTPRSYVFMLAGYTAALIGFPGVATPDAIFNLSVARVEEIALGIVCATLMHSIIRPQGAGHALTGRMQRFMEDMQSWVLDALSGLHDARSSHAHRLAADITELQIMATHLPFDTSDYQNMSREVAFLADRMAALMPLAATVGDRLDALNHRGIALPPESARLVRDIALWVSAGAEARIDAAAMLAERARALEPVPAGDVDLDLMVMASFHARLAELVESYSDCLALGRHIRSGGATPLAEQARVSVLMTPARGMALHLDYGMAAWSGAAAAAAIMTVCAFWILTAWPEGGAAAMLTAIFMSFFAAMDDPAKAISGVALSWLYSIPVAALYLFWIMPMLHSYAMLVLALAPFLLICGVLIAHPAWMMRVHPLALGVLGTLAIQQTFSPHFDQFVNISLASLMGLMTASLVTRLVRTVGPEFSARRLVRRSWADIARYTGARSLPSDMGLIGRMLDRVGLLGPRLAANPDLEDLVAAMLAELRIGLNVLALRRLDAAMSGQAQATVRLLLDDLGQHFRGKAAGMQAPPPPHVLSRIDAAIGAASTIAASPLRREGLLALTGLRRALFPQSYELALPDEAGGAMEGQPA